MSRLPFEALAPVAPRADLRPPTDARRRADRLLGQRDDRVRRSQQLAAQFGSLREYLSIADEVTVALEALSEKLLKELLDLVQDKLTVALQEILEQPIQLRAEASFSRGNTEVKFHIERGGHKEDILRGQGGSVANIVSVGLRMFALTTLDPDRHRRFLVLDEQDCWLRPDLVPRLVKIVHEAGRALGFQVLMISHHDICQFEQYADRIYQFSLNPAGDVVVRPVVARAEDPDAQAEV